MPELYHFSEDPSIEVFEPRPPLAHPDSPARVWAIDARHAPLYYFPSECPRVAFWPLPTSAPEDVRELFPDDHTKMVVAIEHAWIDRFLSTRLYRYGLPHETFIDCQDHGVYVSKGPVRSIECTPVDDRLAWLARDQVELRLCPSLVPLAEVLLARSLQYSMIRMRNAQGWTRPPGTPCVEPE